jgi:hypothetical protein
MARNLSMIELIRHNIDTSVLGTNEVWPKSAMSFLSYREHKQHVNGRTNGRTDGRTDGRNNNKQDRMNSTITLGFLIKVLYTVICYFYMLYTLRMYGFKSGRGGGWGERGCRERCCGDPLDALLVWISAFPLLSS